jgi:hypothetical protein
MEEIVEMCEWNNLPNIKENIMVNDLFDENGFLKSIPKVNQNGYRKDNKGT